MYPNLPLGLFNSAREHKGRTRWVYFKKGRRWKRQSHDITRTNGTYVAYALRFLGHAPGDRVGIISRTRLEWSMTDLAIMASGMISIGIYETSTEEQCSFILRHADVVTCFVEDMNQADKVLSVSSEIPSLKRIIIFTGNVSSAGHGSIELIPFEKILEMGRIERDRAPEWLDRTMESIKPDDTAMIVYTSGTTGDPKGVVLTHHAMLSVIEAARKAVPVRTGDFGVSYLPLAHVLQRTANYTGLFSGLSGGFAESIEKLPEALRDLRPTSIGAVPRIFEKIHARILTMIERSSPRRRSIFNWALGVGKDYSELRREGKKIPISLRLRHFVANILVFRKIKNVFGGRIRFICSGGAPMSMELLKFFDAAGITIYEGYGLTETAAPCTINRPGAIKFGTVGQALDGIEIKIAGDGEICVRGPSVFKEYYKNPEATREAFDEEGYFRTGDIGELDPEGFLKITDRKKDLIITAAGKNIAPQTVENALKATGFISQAVVIGDMRKYLSALIALDADEISSWAKRRGFEFNSASELTDRHEVVQFVGEMVERVNLELPGYERIKRFTILPRELTIEAGELTPTMKARRKIINERYSSLIEKMYE